MKRAHVLHFLRFAVLAISLIVISKSANCAPIQTGDIPEGEHAPDFTLTDQNNREVSLAEMLKKGPVAVVFIRWSNGARIASSKPSSFRIISLQSRPVEDKWS